MNILNNRGYKEFITTLTAVSEKVIKQKFYEIKNLPDFIDFEEGIQPQKDELFKWASGEVAEDGESGVIGANIDYERNASADVIFNSFKYPRIKWAKKITYNWFDIQEAQSAGVIDLIEAKETARKRNFDLMVQKMVFLGSNVNTNLTGLLNNASATVNTTVITKYLSQMTTAEIEAVVPAIINAFRTNSNNTSGFNRLVIPARDFNGLSVPYSSYNNGSKLEVLEKCFKDTMGRYGIGDFKILPCEYCDANHNPSNTNIYACYNKNIDVMTFDLALDYTLLGTNTYDNYNFSNNAVARVGGANIFRPQEMIYFNF